MTPPADTGGSELERRFHELRNRIDERAAKAGELSATLSAVSATAEAGGGAVRATVTASGGLRELMLGAAVRGWEPERIAREVVDCVQQAQARLADAASAALADDSLADLTAGRLRSSFPPVSAERPRRAEDDEPMPDLFDRPTTRTRW
ncbi:hypothetical protein CFN78_25945 [Amycolatopsis antarctica]|uniref:YbaB/EbfC DNA-binding family protein n=1 Tax=Amycolatopsis antarctica TaxID=1854586 RepID=A0A263CW48_9PSEU|nr:YbaB/EbfC family nucleoid-associated protein [Amycolatopsis antarctica]OZM70364.1 hypothetical protein CFN78_25945 [Amycolatopsis antarctica]